MMRPIALITISTSFLGNPERRNKAGDEGETDKDAERRVIVRRVTEFKQLFNHDFHTNIGCILFFLSVVSLSVVFSWYNHTNFSSFFVTKSKCDQWRRDMIVKRNLWESEGERERRFTDTRVTKTIVMIIMMMVMSLLTSSGEEGKERRRGWAGHSSEVRNT